MKSNIKKTKTGRAAKNAVAAEKTAHSLGTEIKLELIRPGAQQVFVAGSFNGWQPEASPLANAGSGQWTGSLKVRPGRHEYLFVVDGQWIPDPNATESVQNPFGGVNSVVVVSE